jgi:glucose/arabinose dehydrogenase
VSSAVFITNIAESDFRYTQPCNICMPPDTHAQIRSINLDGSDVKVVARGIRQTVGMDWHPVTKQLLHGKSA